jgi:hypothetical protein
MKFRTTVCLALILIVCSCIPAFMQDTGADLLKMADDMMQSATRLRGLAFMTPVAKGVKSQAEMGKYFRERIDEEYGDSELAQEGTMLRKLGLIPDSLDYKEFALKLLTEQVGGFYDPTKKSLFIASWLSADEQKPVMVHELVHALQDQHFNIEKIVKEDRSLHNDDKALAHQSIFEGDGTVVMFNYLLEPLKRDFSQIPDIALVMHTMMFSSLSESPVFQSAPVFLQDTLVFPYGYGASFIQKAWAKNPSWQAINKIYSDLPASTEQIMHPEKYYGERDEPKDADAASIAKKLGPDWKITYKNVLGELELGIWLKLQLTEDRALRAAAGWGGDQVLLLVNGSGKNAVLMNTVWDSKAEAQEFYIAVQSWFEKKYPKTKMIGQTESGFSIIQNGEISSVRWTEDNVKLIIGFPESERQKLAGF